MIKDIPQTYASVTDDYLIVAEMKKFFNSQKIKFPDDKKSLLKNLVEFANQSSINEDLVINWFEHCIKEGEKHIYIRKIENTKNSLEFLKNRQYTLKLLSEKFSNCPMENLIFCKSDISLKLQNYYIDCNGESISKIHFIFTQLFREKNFRNIPIVVQYPIFVDLYLDKRYIIVRLKSKSSIYYIKNEEDKKIGLDFLDKVDCTKLITKIIEKICRSLNFSLQDVRKSNLIFKKKYFDILSSLTSTPESIKRQIETNMPLAKNFIDRAFKSINIDYFKNIEKAKYDLYTFFEKFISINYDDKSIFTNGKWAYPFKLLLTDSELTKLEEIASNNDPLQCKERFFDSKKITEYEKQCDGMFLCSKRLEPKYFSSESYIIKLLIKNGYSIIKFESYVEERDIQNVLSRIITD